MADDLYERDFYLWTQAQAEALRARGAGSNRLDYDQLAEEVGDLGASERNASFSLVVRIIQHLYKLQASRMPDPRNHWRKEIRDWRTDVHFKLTASLRHLVEDDLDKLHARAARDAQADLNDHEPGVQLDPEVRWTLTEILGEADDPLAVLH